MERSSDKVIKRVGMIKQSCWWISCIVNLMIRGENEPANNWMNKEVGLKEQVSRRVNESSGT